MNYHKNKGWNEVAQIFYPVVIVLKILGYCPLTFISLDKESSRRSPDDRKPIHWTNSSTYSSRPPPIYKPINGVLQIKDGDYQLTLKSPSCIWAIICALFWTLSWTLILIDGMWTLDIHIFGNRWWHTVQTVFVRYVEQAVEDGSYNRQHGKIIAQYMAVATQVTLTIIMTALLQELLFSWTESKSFAQFINNWKSYEKNFHEAFPTTKTNPIDRESLERSRNLVLFFYVGFSSVLLFFLVSQLPIYNEKNSFLLNTILLAPFVVQAFTAILMEDVKVILTYMTLANAYKQVGRAMTSTDLGAGSTKNWRGLITQLQDQVRLAGDWQKSHQLSIIGMSILTITILIFLALTGPWLVKGFWLYAAVFVGYGMGLLARIYLKILAAENIIVQESMILRELTSFSNDDNLELQMEMKLTYDVLVQNPSDIVFGNYVKLDKKLLLRIASQVVTYLIVLLQFSQTRDPGF